MTGLSWTFQLLLSILPLMASSYSVEDQLQTLNRCLLNGDTHFVVADNFYGVIDAPKHLNQTSNDKPKIWDRLPANIQQTVSSAVPVDFLNAPWKLCDKPVTPCSVEYQKWQKNWDKLPTNTRDLACIIFLQRNTSRYKKYWDGWPQVESNEDLLLYVPKNLAERKLTFSVWAGNCSSSNELCKSGNVTTNEKCTNGVTYDENTCKHSMFNNKYIINMTNAQDPKCVNCDNPIKPPQEKIPLNVAVESVVGNTPGQVDASGAAKFVANIGDLVSQMNGSSAELSVGDGVQGIIVRQTDPADLNQVSFAYQSPGSNLSIIGDAETLSTFSRSVTVTKEAFEKAHTENITFPFAAVIRFLNMTEDENNSTVLGNEVLAIEMGAEIKNLTDTINITFKNINYNGIPQCHSWNGEGGKPNWTNDGCSTIQSPNGGSITCQCSHLTFFAILMTPINETISSGDLKNLTIITQVGCGLSMFFLGVVLFMHFLLRKKKPSQATIILIHLVVAMFLLNLAFLINNFVAKMKNFVGCLMMALFTHYFMLATFSWFASQALHICLQLYTGGQIVFRRYILKVSATSWILPGVIATIVASCGRYGQQTIYADNPQNNVDMCWITDNNVHFIVNIGFYLVVFLFTFTTFIIILSWLFCLKRTQKGETQRNRNGTSIVTMMGLCCQLGMTWGFAFLAYGSFRIPATYIFTILNSFQGFFLFIYYYKTSQVRDNPAAGNDNSSSQTSISTLKSGLDTILNPYDNLSVAK